MGLKAFFHRKKSSRSPDSSISADIAPPPPGQQPNRSPSTRLKHQVQELEQVFKKFDVNGDGKISAAELGSILSSLGQGATEEELRCMIREFDADGDGFIDFQEFVELNTEGVDTDEAMENNLRDAFSVYDVDGNGSITAEELHKVLASLGDGCSIAECRNMISGVDRDGDGMINFEEFKIMMMMGARWDSMGDVRGGVGA